MFLPHSILLLRPMPPSGRSFGDICLHRTAHSVSAAFWYRSICTFTRYTDRDFTCRKSRSGYGSTPLKTELGQLMQAIVPSVVEAKCSQTGVNVIRFPTDNDWYVFQTYCEEYDSLII